MKTLTKIGIVTASIACATLTLTAATMGNNAHSITGVSAGLKYMEITSEMLAATELRDIEIWSGKTDKAFTIELEGGKYVLGAVIFSDCAYQFCGETLGDAFGINNTDSKANAYNFNILFSFQDTSRAKFYVDVGSTAVGNDYVCYSKFGDCDGANFYANLGAKTYNNVIGGPANAYWDNAYGKTETSFASTTSSITVDGMAAYCDVMAFQFTHRNSEYIPAGGSATFTLTGAEFWYDCK